MQKDGWYVPGVVACRCYDRQGSLQSQYPAEPAADSLNGEENGASQKVSAPLSAEAAEQVRLFVTCMSSLDSDHLHVGEPA